jgi:hypothetical protein
MAVGGYNTGNSSEPLAELWNGTSWTIQPLQLPPGATGAYLNGVACASTTFCIAAGFSFGGTSGLHDLEENWNGAIWQAHSVDFSSAILNSVSCASATACMAVGVTLGNPMALFWNGSNFTGVVISRPLGGATSAALTGVSCAAAWAPFTACTFVGNFTPLTNTSQERTFGYSWVGTGSGYNLTFLSTPSPGQSTSAFNGLACASGQCWAVGSFDTFTGQQAAFGNDSSWEVGTFAPVTSQPAGFPSVLNGDSCTTGPTCMFVGDFKNGSGSFVPLAWQVSPGSASTGPAFFSLSVSGAETQSAPVTAVLRKPRVLDLQVQAIVGNTLVPVGLVSLGSYPAGRSLIPWDLFVDGHRLPPGSYAVSLHALSNVGLSLPAAPGSRTLIVLPNGDVRVGA